MRTAHEMRARATQATESIDMIFMSPSFDDCGPRQIIAGLKQLEATLWEVTAEVCDRLDNRQSDSSRAERS